jgi:hypothetical protein
MSKKTGNYKLVNTKYPPTEDLFTIPGEIMARGL